ncbi:MAG: LytTR family DNA-binding domain-containing protein [Bacteroidota bacterium]
MVKDAFFVKQNNLLCKVPFHTVLWIKTEGNYSVINTSKGEFTLKLSLKKVLEQLPSYYFMQIQRAFIISLHQVQDIDMTSNEVVIQGKRLPIGRNYREDLLSRLRILK